jgi:hypothetical protein
MTWRGAAAAISFSTTSDAIARLSPIPDTDRFELFYWSNVKGRWMCYGLFSNRRNRRTTFGPMSNLAVSDHSLS